LTYLLLLTGRLEPFSPYSPNYGSSLEVAAARISISPTRRSLPDCRQAASYDSSGAKFRFARDPPGISQCVMVKDIDNITPAWLDPGFVFYKHP
jgi:hypothetical protein